jgi:hypothetical protein
MGDTVDYHLRMTYLVHIFPVDTVASNKNETEQVMKSSS